MRKVVIPAFLLVLGSLVLGATVLRGPIADAATPFTNVIVSNTASNPVPVREQATDANGNLKVHEQGTATVNVVDNHEPWQHAFSVNVADGSNSGEDFYTVPAGKRLVVQYVGVQADVPPNEGVLIQFSATGELGTFGGVPIVSGGVAKTTVGDFVRWAGGGPVLSYSGPGQQFAISIERESSVSTAAPSGEAEMTFVASGYLVPSS
jgi:hypothetical protein